ncbi:ImmA/IrrE family metallo-endopeptidase [Burkholderia vietnamiensis]|uniref:ImmA/IrrE family metallo-endopeptidase n=1 Tax=Burkholderia vietnamiensis TaxID=60552 RepID=UPI00158EA11C|nr:ImmA/IrrE family metallo-endopeptidase [Burkholderia vietnamiensis]MBR8087608.1 ImmA/IrrE family metallo-endopeptidase [Burkholderia vietnamiensis]MCA8232307.1 ImmA/IrrE family metallo-endopeptidase [Burkholderia vietnamiensis]MDN7820837.1 ImmA/IrrE family metallo-endopeptidase [Burkholderia vietnamiensis]
MTPGEHAETLISEFGISSPSELDVEAIACDAGMDVRYELLDGCEATLVGVKNHAIATIRPSGNRGRERFSIAHELGHWNLHRGKAFRCRVDDQSENMSSDRGLEREADSYAAHLLMPRSLFDPAIRAGMKFPTFKHIDDVAQAFEVSMAAAVIRMAEVDSLPVIVSCYNAQGIRWRAIAPHVPRRWRLVQTLDEDSFAYDIVNGNKAQRSSGKQSADAWFSNDDADRYEVHEHAMPGRTGEALVLLYLTDTEMFETPFEGSRFDRRYGERDRFDRR